jgi:tetratricopeptide (TPR) repeat protein
MSKLGFRGSSTTRCRYRVLLLLCGLALSKTLLCWSQPAPGATARSATAASSRQNALAFEQRGKIAEAEAAWREVVKAHPSDPEAFAHLGLIEAHKEDYKQAIQFYRKALALNPKFPGLRLNLGLAFFKDGDMENAIRQFEPLLKSSAAGTADAEKFNILIGMAHYGEGDFKEAVPYLKAAADADQQNLAIRLTLGHSCMWSKQYQCVMDTYHEILALNADSAEADMMAGEALDGLKDDAGAVEQFRAAIKVNPKEPNAHFGLGYLLWTEKHYPEAAKEFKAELANDPAHVQSIEYLADANIQMNEFGDSRPLLEKANKINPNLPLVHLDLAILDVEEGKQEAALREFAQAEKLNPNEVDVHWRLGRLYRSMGRKDEAKAEFDKATALTKAKDEEVYRKINNPDAKPPGAVEAAPANAPAVSPN